MATFSYEIIQIPRDDKSIHLYVERYKAFRLLSLKTAPDAFGSTYAREIAFTEQTWYDRLANPKATTFLALESDRVVCMLTTMGPLLCTPEESEANTNPWVSLSDQSAAELPYYHLRINAMFTHPEARGQSLALGLIQRAFKYGCEEAAKSGQAFTASIVVDADNIPAKTLYEKSGFVTISEHDEQPRASGARRVAVLMKYTPESVPK